MTCKVANRQRAGHFHLQQRCSRVFAAHRHSRVEDRSDAEHRKIGQKIPVRGRELLLGVEPQYFERGPERVGFHQPSGCVPIRIPLVVVHSGDRIGRVGSDVQEFQPLGVHPSAVGIGGDQINRPVADRPIQECRLRTVRRESRRRPAEAEDCAVARIVGSELSDGVQNLFRIVDPHELSAR